STIEPGFRTWTFAENSTRTLSWSPSGRQCVFCSALLSASFQPAECEKTILLRPVGALARPTTRSGFSSAIAPPRGETATLSRRRRLDYPAQTRRGGDVALLLVDCDRLVRLFARSCRAQREHLGADAERVCAAQRARRLVGEPQGVAAPTAGERNLCRRDAVRDGAVDVVVADRRVHVSEQALGFLDALLLDEDADEVRRPERREPR